MSGNDTQMDPSSTGDGPIGRYQALLEAARHMSSSLDLESLLTDILRRARQVMNAEASSVFLPDGETGDLVIHSALGDKAPMLNATRIPRGAGVAGSVFSGKKTVNTQDTKNDPRHYKKVDDRTGFQTRAMITTPLLEGDKCLGVLQILNPLDRPHFDDQDEAILEGFASLIAATLIRLEGEKNALAAAKARQELEFAREIQKSFLPPPSKNLPSCRLWMGYFPAREVGGDFYFIHDLEDGRTLCGLGDVSGKGIPAALTMARATAEIRALAPRLKDDLGEWVELLNDGLCEELTQGRFIGATFLLTDRNTQTLHICTAGQNPPAFTEGGHPWQCPTCPPQMPLGILSGRPYKSTTTALKPGQLWMLFSDGITEARSPSGEELTQEGFLKSLPVGLTGEASFHAAIDSWKHFTGTADPHDDASLVLLHWRGAKPESHFLVNCCPETMCNGRHFIEKWANYAGFDDITVCQLVLAVDEAATNVFRHAYGNQPGPLEYHCSIEDGSLMVTLKDQGKPVEKEKLKGRELDDLRPGGLGIVLLNNIFDNVDFQPLDKGTLLALSKRIPT